MTVSHDGDHVVSVCCVCGTISNKTIVEIFVLYM